MRRREPVRRFLRRMQPDLPRRRAEGRALYPLRPDPGDPRQRTPLFRAGAVPRLSQNLDTRPHRARRGQQAAGVVQRAAARLVHLA